MDEIQIDTPSCPNKYLNFIISIRSPKISDTEELLLTALVPTPLWRGGKKNTSTWRRVQ